MKGRGVCAVVITFNPQADVLENLAWLRPQVEGLVVVDNSLTKASVAWLHVASRDLDFVLIENKSNLGLAAALNIGARWAKAYGFSFVLLFDQDSTVTGDFTQSMMTAYASHPDRQWVAVVTPSQVERSTGAERRQPSAQDGGPLVAITSGSLMPIEIFDQCGWFQEDLIIDCVDHEYCLRARSMGFTIAECREARLLVAVGSANRHQVLGYAIYARHYKATRRYYITRNRLVMILRFWRQQPRWCCITLRDMVQEIVKVVLVEEERWSKIRNTALGIHDAFYGRMGMVVEL